MIDPDVNWEAVAPLLEHIDISLSGTPIIEKTVESVLPALELADSELAKMTIQEAHNQELRELPISDAELLADMARIPDKMAFKIGEVADLVGVKQYVLRYWESEFEALRPKKSNHNQRMYTRRDVEMVMMIKKLLYRDRFSISGAISALRRLKGQVKQERRVMATVEHYEAAVEKAYALRADITRMKALFC